MCLFLFSYSIFLRYQAGTDGAIVLTFSATTDYIQNPTINDIIDVAWDPQVGININKFIKVEDLEWGAGFQGREFYNHPGFSVKYEDGQHISYQQFWIAGKNVDAGFHNHKYINL